MINIKRLIKHVAEHYLNAYFSFFVISGSISHHDMWDYLHLSKAGYSRVFEPVHELLLQILDEDDEKLERNANLETLSIDEN